MQIKYIFFSERLAFRNWNASDIPLFARLSSDAEVMKYFPSQFWLDEEQAKLSISNFQKHYLEHGYTYFAVDLKATREFIGFIGMKAISYKIFFAPAVDIGWRLDKKHWGKGLATEGAKKCIEWFFETFEVDHLVSITPVLNKASENVMKKVGMSKTTEFEHPLLDKESPLLKHLLYEIRNN